MSAISSYHVEIDDDPNFGSPEVDVTVAGTQCSQPAPRPDVALEARMACIYEQQTSDVLAQLPRASQWIEMGWRSR